MCNVYRYMTVKKKAPKVNAALAAKLERDMNKVEGEDGKKKKKKPRGDTDGDSEGEGDEAAAAGGLLADDRFGAMFKAGLYKLNSVGTIA
jgi:hypothetical protein